MSSEGKRKKILPPLLSFSPDENNTAAKVPKASTRKYWAVLQANAQQWMCSRDKFVVPLPYISLGSNNSKRISNNSNWIECVRGLFQTLSPVPSLLRVCCTGNPKFTPQIRKPCHCLLSSLWHFYYQNDHHHYLVSTAICIFNKPWNIYR